MLVEQLNLARTRSGVECRGACHTSTPLKNNMDAKNDDLQNEFPIQWDDFQVPC